MIFSQSAFDKHLPLIHKFANRFSAFGCMKEDLVQEGSLALILSMEAFDETKDIRLISFAYPRIKGAILEYAMRHSNGAVSIPRRSADSRKYPISADAVTAELPGDESNAFVSDQPDSETSIFEQEVDFAMNEAISRLSQLERIVFCHRYGIGDCIETTQAELCTILGVSQPTISRIEQTTTLKVIRFVRDKLSGER